MYLILTCHFRLKVHFYAQNRKCSRRLNLLLITGVIFNGCTQLTFIIGLFFAIESVQHVFGIMFVDQFAFKRAKRFFVLTLSNHKQCHVVATQHWQCQVAVNQLHVEFLHRIHVSPMIQNLIHFLPVRRLCFTSQISGVLLKPSISDALSGLSDVDLKWRRFLS